VRLGGDLPTVKLAGRGVDTARECAGRTGESRNVGSLYQFGCTGVCPALLVFIAASMSADNSATMPLPSGVASSSNTEVGGGSVFSVNWDDCSGFRDGG
jgi:hypothetical protein